MLITLKGTIEVFYLVVTLEVTKLEAQESPAMGTMVERHGRCFVILAYNDHRLSKCCKAQDVLFYNKKIWITLPCRDP